MKKIKTIPEWIEEEEKIAHELKIAEQNLRIKQNMIKKLTRNERTHRLCKHGALLEKYLPPDQFSDKKMEAVLFHVFRQSESKKWMEEIRLMPEHVPGPTSTKSGQL